jgi:hypothetical protein
MKHITTNTKMVLKLVSGVNYERRVLVKSNVSSMSVLFGIKELTKVPRLQMRKRY